VPAIGALPKCFALVPGQPIQTRYRQAGRPGDQPRFELGAACRLANGDAAHTGAPRRFNAVDAVFESVSANVPSKSHKTVRIGQDVLSVTSVSCR
jgi:hypothetical protein